MKIRNKIILIITALMVFAVFTASCAKDAPSPAATGQDEVTADQQSEGSDDAGTPVTDESDSSDDEEDSSMSKLVMTINDEELNVSWEDNESVAALRDLAANGPVVIKTSAYGGFEQVGPIGTTLPSNDTSIKTKAGDIMLYTSDNIVVFYGSNSWSYTRLGHIENKSRQELADLLGGNNAVITITAE